MNSLRRFKNALSLRGRKAEAIPRMKMYDGDCFAALAMTLLICVLLTSCSGCPVAKKFDPKAPLEQKWAMVSEWVPGDSIYVVLIDVYKFAATEFYQKAIAGNRSIPLLNGFNAESDGGIAVITGELFFLGGDFKPEEVIKRIKASVENPKNTVTEVKYKDKVIYADPAAGSSFVFLEKYILCYGSEADIKSLIDNKEAKKIQPPGVVTSKMVWGRFSKDLIIYGKAKELTFTAEATSNLKISAEVLFDSAKDAALFADELKGIKAIKTIQSIDEPWIADVIDSIAIVHAGDKVGIAAVIDDGIAKKLLKRGLK